MKSKKKNRTVWASEAEMCAAFITAAEAQGWVAHPEAAGHDLVLVAGPCHYEPGVQVAVEAKLHANLHLLAQAVPPQLMHMRYDGANEPSGCADWYAILVPGCDTEYRDVAAAMCVFVIEMPAQTLPLKRYEVDTAEAAAARLEHLPEHWRWSGYKPLTLGPPVKMEAGKPSPRRVTRWKLNAVRLAMLGRSRELEAADFRAASQRRVLWLDRHWLVETRREGRRRWYRTAQVAPDTIYPEIATALLEEKP